MKVNDYTTDVPANTTHFNPNHDQCIGVKFYRFVDDNWYYYSTSIEQWLISTNKKQLMD